MDNSVLNSINDIFPRKAPGIYMILCLINDYRYYGETNNLSSRIFSHKSMVRRKIHINEKLQNDWNLYGEISFTFTVLFIGKNWKIKKNRLIQESKLIAENSEMCYNIFESYEFRIGELNPFFQKKHSEKTKKFTAKLCKFFEALLKNL